MDDINIENNEKNSNFQNENLSYQNQANISAHETQNNKLLNSGKMKIIILTIIVVLAVGGFVYGAWYAYDSYFASPTLADLMLNSAEHFENTKIYQIDYDLDLELVNNDISDVSMLGNNILGGLFKDSAKQTIDLKGYSYVDQSDKENMKSEGNFKLTLGTGMGSLDVSSKLTDKVFYLKPNDLPTILSVFVDLENLGDNWISIDINKDEGALNKYKDYFEEDENCLEGAKDFMRDFLQNNQLYEMVKDCSSEKGENGSLINCRFKIKTSAIQKLVKDFKLFEKDKCKINNMDKMENIDWDQFEKINSNIVYDVDFSKKEKYITKISVLYKNIQADNLVRNGVFEVYVDDKVEQKKIAAPSKTIGLDEFIKILFSGFMNNAQMYDPDQAYAADSLDMARAKSRDAKRMSDIKQIMTGLELYYVDNGSYPVSREKIVLGKDGYMSLCSSGFSTSSCDVADITYMRYLPANPEPNGKQYVYYSDGKTYNILFALEIGSGNYSAGDMIGAQGKIKNLVSTTTEAKAVDFGQDQEDSDGDGLADFLEEQKYFTNKNNPDTDGDGYSDGEEVKNGYNPNGPGLLR